MPHTLQPTHIQHCSSTTLQRTILRIPPIFDGGIEKIRNSEGQHRDTHRHLYQASLIITYSNLSAPRELRHCLHSASASLKPGRRWMATLMCFYYQTVLLNCHFYYHHLYKNAYPHPSILRLPSSLILR